MFKATDTPSRTSDNSQGLERMESNALVNI